MFNQFLVLSGILVYRLQKCPCISQSHKACDETDSCSCGDSQGVLNSLCRLGVDLQWVRHQSCLMDNLASMDVSTLQEQFQRCIACTSCGLKMSLLQGLASSMVCSKCLLHLSYSWCQDSLDMGANNILKWRHCDFCSKCTPRYYIHCQVIKQTPRFVSLL